MGRRTIAQDRAELAEVAAELEQVNDRREELYRRRDALFVRLRECYEKPLTQRELAEDARCKEVAVVAALAKIGRVRGQKVR